MLLIIVSITSAVIADEAAVSSEVVKSLEKNSNVKVFIKLKQESQEQIKPMLRSAAIRSDLSSEKEDIISGLGGDKVKHDFGDYFSAKITEDDLETLRKDPRIESVTPVRILSKFLQDSVPLINATKAWAVQVNNVNMTGKGQAICIIDTGVNYNLADLGGCYGNNDNTSSCKVIGGYDFCADDDDCSEEDPYPLDVDGHGTHVSGIAAANGSIKGVAPEAKIIMIKAYSVTAGGFYDDDLIAGISWCVNNRSKFNISVISMSLGTNCQLQPQYCYSSYCNSDPLAAAVNSAVAVNISVVAASGNNGNYVNISTPACIQNATAIGSSTKADAISSFSNRNSLVNIVAPGSSITSTVMAGGYEAWDGTSMATPHAAGAIAIISQYTKSRGIVKTVDQIKSILNSTGKKINDSGYSNLNYSRIDVYSAIASIGDLTNPTVTLNSPSANTSSAQLTFRCNVTDNVNISNVTLYHNLTGSFIANITNSSRANGSYSFIQNMTQGVFVWNCYSCDNSSNCAFASSNITFIIDTTNPYFSPAPTNQTSEYGSSFSYDTDAYDTMTSVDSYRINNSNFSISSSGVITNATLLSLRVYYLNISVNDSVGNVNNTIIFVNVSDTTSPYFNPVPSNQTAEYGNVFAYDVNASDNHNVSNYSVSDIVNFTISSIGNLTNKTVLTLGSYALNITANDSSGNRNSTIIVVTVYDTKSPYFNISPTNKELNYSQALGYQINATDNFMLANYSVNDTSNFAINSSGYLKNNTLLSVSKYYINITINDTSGNQNSTVISITVKLNSSSSVSANISTDLDLSNANSNITLYLSRDVNTTLTIAKETPSSKPDSSFNTLKGINITVDNATNASISWALIKIYYISSELTAANIDESTLKIYYYNDSASAWQLEPNQGVNTANDYVWANISHFSLFGTFGTAPSSTTPGGSTSGGGGGSSSSSTIQSIALSKTLVSYQRISQNSKFVFASTDSKQHTLTLKVIYSDRVDFELASDQFKFTLLIGEDKTINITSTEKLYLILDSIANKKASISIKNIVPRPLAVIEPPKKEPKKETQEVEPTIINETKTENDKKAKINWNPILKIAGLIIVFLVLVLFIIFSSKKLFKKEDIAVKHVKGLLEQGSDEKRIVHLLKKFGRKESEINDIIKKAKR